MNMTKKEIFSRGLLLILALWLALPAASANALPLETRLAGQDRYETASVIAKQGRIQADNAILAFGENFPDALAAAPLAQKYQAPILLTTTGQLPEITKRTLTDLKVRQVFIVGGLGVVSASVEAELLSMGMQVTRLAGQDRYETAVRIAEQLDSHAEIAVVTGEDYPDALSIAPVAGLKQMPIILVPRQETPQAVKEYLAAFNVQKAFIVGDDEVIGDQVVEQFVNAERITGSDPYARNIAVANRFRAELSGKSVYAATGKDFADALTGTVLAAAARSPLILVADQELSGVVKTYLRENLPAKEELFLLGGTAVLADDLFNNLAVKTYSPAEIWERVSPAVVRIEVYEGEDLYAAGEGSGFISDPNGKIVTNYHVIEQAARLSVHTADGQTYEVQEICAYDELRDVAVLRIAATGLPAVKLGDSDAVRTGDRIYTIGSPMGLEYTLSDGLVSQASRTVQGQAFIQISAPISPGSSGGVLLNERAEVIGIPSRAEEGFGAQNLNMAIPINSLLLYLGAEGRYTLAEVAGSVEAGRRQKLEDLREAVNQAYGTLTVGGQPLHFTWEIEAEEYFDFRTIELTGVIDAKDDALWPALAAAKRDEIAQAFSQMAGEIKEKYPNEGLLGAAVRRFTTTTRPSLPKDELGQISQIAENEWEVVRPLVIFIDSEVMYIGE